MDENPRIHIIRRPPQPHEGSLRHDPQLIPERGRKSQRRGLGLPLLPFDGISFNSFDFAEGLLEFEGFAPQLCPVTVSDSRSEPCTDRVEHVFGWVNVVRTHCAATSEVFADDGRVGPDITEIDLRKGKLSMSRPEQPFGGVRTVSPPLCNKSNRSKLSNKRDEG